MNTTTDNDIKQLTESINVHIGTHEKDIEQYDNEIINLLNEVDTLKVNQKVLIDEIEETLKNILHKEVKEDELMKLTERDLNSYVEKVQNFECSKNVEENQTNINKQCAELEGKIEALKLTTEFQENKIKELTSCIEKMKLSKN